MKLENLTVKSVDEHLTQTDEGDKKRWAVSLENKNTKVKLVFEEQPEQAFVPNEVFTLLLKNPQKTLPVDA